MKRIIVTCLILVATAGIGYSQSAADNATLPYSPEQIATYIHDCTNGTEADKKFIISLDDGLKVPAANDYSSAEEYKKALNSWATNNPALVEKFLIERRNYQQGNH